MDTRIMELMRDNAALAGEVRVLRSRVGRRDSMIVRRAHVDALDMIEANFLGYGTGRVEMGRVGMTKRRWQWACAYLRYVKVVSRHTVNWRSGLTWMVTGPEAIRRVHDAQGVTYTHLCGLKRCV